MTNVREIRLAYAPRSAFRPLHARTQRWACMVAHRRAGKALDIETAIPMADGSWKKMGQLRDGDRVLDERGQPCNVLAAHPVTLGRPCYEVQFSDGASVVCDEDHLWATQTKLDRTHHFRTTKGSRGAAKTVTRTHVPRAASVKTTAQIRDSLLYQGESNHSVALAGAAEYPEADLPIDPYILGLWLGDGTSRSAQFTTMDEEITEEFRLFADGRGYGLRPLIGQNAGRATTWIVTGDRKRSLGRELAALGVLGNKHIPEAYMSASKSQRLALLRGLMDTDGSIAPDRNAQCEVTQKREDLAVQIAALLYSLGEKPSLNIKMIGDGRYYRVIFRSAFNPFRLARKARGWRPVERRGFSRRRYITAVEPVQSRPVRCITVDSPNSLYLCGREFIPTHNTIAAINDTIRHAITDTRGSDALYGYVAPYRSQAKAVAWKYLKHYSRPILKLANEAELTVTLVNDAQIRLFGADNADTMRGLGFCGIILDEYGDFRPSVFDAVIRPALSDKQGWATFMGTPKGKNQFYDIRETARRSPDEWFYLNLPASTSGILPPSELAALRAQMTEDRFNQEYECSFDAAILGAYYGVQMREATEQGRITSVPYQPQLPTFTAWDLGYRDDTAIWWFQVLKGEVHFIDCYAVSGASIEDLANVVKAKPYHYAKHLLPHDARAKTLASNRSIIEQLADHLGFGNLGIVPNIGVQDGIQAVRMMLPHAWFDEERCYEGTEAVRQYQREYDEDRKAFREAPKHDWTSHYADSLRMASIAWQKEAPAPAPRQTPTLMVGNGGTATLEDLYADQKRFRRERI